MTIYFIADTHFGHANVLKHSNRPFDSVEEMDSVMMKNWNARVKPDDEVYILGDFCWHGGEDVAIDLAKSLNGRKYLIKGNHDWKYLKNAQYREQFVEVADMMEVVQDGNRIVLCHYPLLEYNGERYGGWHIHGHIHNRKDDTFYYLRNKERSLNAGVEIINYMPVTFEELVELNHIYKRGEHDEEQ